jgi:UDP-glucose 4-epimerase|tara:strand:+ start:1060 stop:1962 length:903 start_codon:yes stop_codon:yes gene_type:complete
MKKVAVVGGAGFIGSNIVDTLVDKGIKVIVLDNLSTGYRKNVNSKAELVECDISTSSIDFLQKTLEGCEVVFHTAALARVQPSILEPVKFDKVNVNGTVNLLKACVEAGVKRVVYSASSSCYGNCDTFPTPESYPTNPLSPYGLQKYIGELYCKMFSQVYNIDTVCLRYFNVYGERMNFEGAYKLVIAVFAEQHKKGIPLTITNDGNQRRDFTYVKDVVEANILAATHKEQLSGDVFNIGNGNNFSVNEVADIFGGEKHYFKFVLEPFETLADNTKAKLILGWKPKGNLKEWLTNYIKTL